MNASALNIISIEETGTELMLKKKAERVLFPLALNDKQLIQDMKTKLYYLQGVGLAAPQVNYARQIIAVYIPESAALLRDNIVPYPMHILINAEYKPVANTQVVRDFEGCYSVHSKAGLVPRYHQIELTYFDEEGEKHQQIVEGFYARVLQHEIDHIDGVLITDRLTPDCVQGTLEEMRQLRRKTLSPEKQALFDKLMQVKEE